MVLPTKRSFPAHQWAEANLSGQALTEVDYLTTIRTLLLTTQNPERTTIIGQSVLTQAIATGKTSVWVDQEIKFEGMITGVDRADLLLFELHEARTALDS